MTKAPKRVTFATVSYHNNNRVSKNTHPSSSHKKRMHKHDHGSALSKHKRAGAAPAETRSRATRNKIACERCRKRKIKCNGSADAGEGCENCITAGEEHRCRYNRVGTDDARTFYFIPDRKTTSPQASGQMQQAHEPAHTLPDPVGNAHTTTYPRVRSIGNVSEGPYEPSFGSSAYYAYPGSSNPARQGSFASPANMQGFQQYWPSYSSIAYYDPTNPSMSAALAPSSQAQTGPAHRLHSTGSFAAENWDTRSMELPPLRAPPLTDEGTFDPSHVQDQPAGASRYPTSRDATSFGSSMPSVTPTPKHSRMDLTHGGIPHTSHELGGMNVHTAAPPLPPLTASNPGSLYTAGLPSSTDYLYGTHGTGNVYAHNPMLNTQPDYPTSHHYPHRACSLSGLGPVQMMPVASQGYATVAPNTHNMNMYQSSMLAPPLAYHQQPAVQTHAEEHRMAPGSATLSSVQLRHDTDSQGKGDGKHGQGSIHENSNRG